MRVENWPRKMFEALREAESQVFSWGDFDCFYWTNHVIEEMTGNDNMRAFFEKQNFTPERPYMTGKGMKRTIKNLGYNSFYEIICDIYGEPVEAKRARRGDLLMLALNGFEALGICRGVDVLFKTREGNILFAPRDCEHAWRIG